MTLTPDEAELFRQAVQELKKLNLEVARLRTDVRTLAGRIEPYENEKIQVFEAVTSKHLKTMRDVLDHFVQIRRGLVESQNAISWVVARVDQIHNDSWSREDMKPWLKGGQK